MPITDVKVMEGVLTAEQKQKIARGCRWGIPRAVVECLFHTSPGRTPKAA